MCGWRDPEWQTPSAVIARYAKSLRALYLAYHNSFQNFRLQISRCHCCCHCRCHRQYQIPALLCARNSTSSWASLPCWLTHFQISCPTGLLALSSALPSYPSSYSLLSSTSLDSCCSKIQKSHRSSSTGCLLSEVLSLTALTPTASSSAVVKR